MAEADGNTFDKIVLTGPAGVILKRGFAYKVKVKSYRLIKKFAPKFAERHFGSAEYRALSPVMKESYKKIVNEDLRKVASRVQNPVLIIQGKGDTTTPIEEASAYLSVLPNGKLELIDGGHFAFAENPLPFNLTAEEFLL
jgi:pimeloyl-ACP methyl ester carboxylesterase